MASSNITSINFIIFLCDFNLFKACISRKLFTWSIFVKEFLRHFIATYTPDTKFWALNTSLNVPSPNFLTNLYSVEKFLLYISYYF